MEMVLLKIELFKTTYPLIKNNYIFNVFLSREKVIFIIN